MYSGGKEGIVKIWKMKKRQLKCCAQLTGQASSINTLCRLDKQFGKMFASGSSDKSIRMWKFKSKYAGGQSDDEEQEEEEKVPDNDEEIE